LLATGFLLLVATSGLSACRTAPSVAAYVGAEQVSVSELDAAVDERLSDADIAAYAEGKEDEFTRAVLARLVQQEVFTAAAERYDVQVSNVEVRARIDELLAEQDAEAEYANAAAQGFSRDDVAENIREQLIAQKIAEAQGKAEGVSEEALQQAYEQARASTTTVRLGYIAVPDQATADAVLAQLTADPSSYPTVAARFPGQFTLPELQEYSASDIPAPLAPQVAAAPPGTGFTIAIPEAGGVLVGFVGPFPSFEELRPQLEQQATLAAAQAGAALVADVREDLHVRTNPRFKETDGDSGVVDILGDTGTATG
jgi:peptidyl-prolyl cis-trans isomerase SurA